ncbi:hypothetical protein [Pseudoalteromonas sp. MMG022]|uniref:hypothetical protein n=1 Tax=Pseudoalteromonas sp. MMG022 TaxID=2909978 RepID=UPI001F19F675|nr:hypothetical protein [Pseudoalteromonas sp. MMG022]MCF6435238.1 hypothetical protein [Pseudoalteromonas sp. MMG022]
MSEQDKTMTQRLTDVVTAADSLTQTVQNQIGQINSTVSAKMSEVDTTIAQANTKVDNYIGSARSEYSHILLSRNQGMEPASATAIKGFNTIYTNLEVTKEATIHGIPDYDTDHTGSGVGADFRAAVYDGYVNGYFNILRLKWTRTNTAHPSRIDNNWSSGYQQGALTSACYLKVLSGSVSGSMSPVVDCGNDWHLYAERRKAVNSSAAFHTSHSKLTFDSEQGEALICLFGTASGYVDLESAGWSLFPEFARPSDIPA